MSVAQKNSIKSTEIIASVSFFALSLYLMTSITIRHYSQSTEQLWVKSETSRLSTQIAYMTGSMAFTDILGAKVPARNTRNVASVRDNLESLKKVTSANWKDEGTLGKDPWGRPYRYKVFRDDSGVAQKVAVWSEGKNSQNETDFSAAAFAAKTSQSIFLGDDTGFIRAIDTLDKL